MEFKGFHPFICYNSSTQFHDTKIKQENLNINKEFFDACISQNVEKVTCLAEKYQGKILDDVLESCLLNACILNNLAICEILIQNLCTTVVFQDPNGDTPLHHAVRNQNLQLIELLLSFGAYLNTPNNNKITPVGEAFCIRDYQIAKLFKEHGANLVDCSKNSLSPLQVLCMYPAPQKNTKALFDFLIQMNPLVIEQTNSFKPIMPLAYSCDNAEIVELICTYIKDMPTINFDMSSTMHDAISHVAIDCIKKLLESKLYDVNFQDTEGNTPLQHALNSGIFHKIYPIFSNDPSLLNSLKLENKELGLKDAKILKNTPLFLKYPYHFLKAACVFSNIELLEELLQRNFDYSSDPIALSEIVNQSATKGRFLTLKTLHKNSISLEIQNQSGTNLLHAACRSGNVELISWIIELGYDVNSKDNHGSSPLCYALACNTSSSELIDLLVAKGINIYEQFLREENIAHIAIDSDVPVSILEKLFEIDTESKFLSSRDESGNGLMHYAIRSQNEKIIDFLLQKDVDLNIQDADGKTCLFHAIKEMPKVIGKLIEHGIDLGIVDEKGQTALFSCFPKSSKAARAIIHERPDLLIQKDFKGRTPLHLACANLPLEEFQNLLAIAMEQSKDENVLFWKDNQEHTFLHYAASNDDSNVLSFIIQSGLNINAKAKNDVTALHLSIKLVLENNMKLLLNCDADFNARLKDGSSCLDLAIQTEDDTMIQFFLEKGMWLFDRPLSVTYPSDYFHNRIPKLVQTHYNTQCFDIIKNDDDFIHIVEATMPESLHHDLMQDPHLLLNSSIPTEKTLEVLWLLQNRRIIARIIPQISKNDFSVAYEKLKEKHPQHDFTNYFCFAEVNSEHFLSTIIPKISQTSLHIQELEQLIEELEFVDKEHPNYIPQELLIFDKKQINPIEMKNYFKIYVERITKEIEFTYTGKEGSDQIKQFYSNLKKMILPVVEKLKSLGYDPLEKALKMKILLDLLPCISHCGPRWQMDALKANMKYCQERPLDTKLSIFFLLQEFRGLIIEGMVDKKDSNNIHKAIALTNHFAQELGLFSLNFKDEHAEHLDFDPEEIIKKFFKVYTPKDIVQLVHTEINNSSSIRDLFMEYLYKAYEDVVAPVGIDIDEHLISLWYDGAKIKESVVAQVLSTFGIIRIVRPQ